MPAIILWLVIWLCTGGVFYKHHPLVSLVHDGKYITVPPGSPYRQAIQIQPVVKRKVSIPFTLPAVIQAMPAKLVLLYPPVLGRVVQVNKQAGEAVDKGEVLLAISSPDLAQSINEMRRAEAALTLTKTGLVRQKKLFAAHIGAEQDLEQAQSDYDQAWSEWTRAHAKLKILRVNKEDFDGSGRLIVRSPISGYVLEVNAGVGTYWNDPTAQLMSVADLSKVYVMASAQESDLSRVYVGQHMTISFDALPSRYHTTVGRIHPILDDSTRTFGIMSVLDNRKIHLKPNMFAKAVLMSPAQERLVLPLNAVIQRGFDSIVFVEKTPWHFETRLVQLGPQLDSEVEILSGLQPNERVVVAGGVVLND
ncbi:MAG: efflux RND transporter periplasmic adaptor subunit [Gammaproteobacteria bacterium]|nr:efflux RND transporter periplasmic adaptor subunit [Gammaproteobacteria bacterium]